jgi:hypothetical protein
VVSKPTVLDVEKPSGQYLGFIYDESLTRRGLNLNSGHFRGSTILPLFVWRIVFACLMVAGLNLNPGHFRGSAILPLFIWRIKFSCLVVAGGRCDMTGSDEDHGRSRRPDADDQRWSSTNWILGG